jgi:hypothetical protein
MRALIASIPLMVTVILPGRASAHEPTVEVPPPPPILVAAPGPASIVPDYLVPPPPTPVGPGYVASPKAYGPFAEKVRTKLAIHRRSPSGVPTPIGSGNAWTEFKFVFGSSRQFFGAGDASQGVWNHATVPPPSRYP